ncbi:DUF58 domain-containing protein [Salmonella enterica]|nr:DUF58 domain-containing protein [Salmonella enterica]
MTHQDGVYVTAEELLAFEAGSRQLALGYTRVTNNLLQGNRPSRINGRGGAFDQIRQYVQGDDVRDIDWNVTARMRGVPYVRVFNEERERPFYLLLDQTNDMFFGTRRQLKSVLAARLAAHLLWMAHHKKQPYGLVLLTENQVECFSPRHHRGHLIHLFSRIASANQQLSSSEQKTEAPARILTGLQYLRQHTGGNALMTLLSDFHLVDPFSWRLIDEIAAHAQTLAMPIYDGIIHHWPTHGQFLATWGGIEAELMFATRQQRQQIAQRALGNLSDLQLRLEQAGVSASPVSTWLPADEQLREALMLTGVSA